MRPFATLDLECFHNWFLVGITDHETETRWDYQLYPGHPLDIDAVTQLCCHYTLVTFNGENYDIPMLTLALTGADNATIKAANDAIIERGLRNWMFYREYNLYKPKFIDTIDVSEPTPGVRVSLKQYACRMSLPIVQDSPVNFNVPIPWEDIPHEIAYCRNDRDATWEIWNTIKQRINLRMMLGQHYGIDLRSKSDAQMAEAMMKAAWARRIKASEIEGRSLHVGVEYVYDYNMMPKPNIPVYHHGTTFKARLPGYLEFATESMRGVLQTVRDADFFISNKDEAELLGIDDNTIKTGVLIPGELKGLDIRVCDNPLVFRMGIGGLHSQESSVSHISEPGKFTMWTADVTSYYPSLIMAAGMFPPQLGPAFLEIYRDWFEQRVSNKETAARLKALDILTPSERVELETASTNEGGLKIALNGTFGKLWSRFSIFYAPELGVAVTMSGQLSLLMLIERLQLSGITVVSANTDGIECKVPYGSDWLFHACIKWWEQRTQLNMETHSYWALYARDVNNYISVGWDKKLKCKGVFRESGLLENKHPDLDICAEAVCAYITKGVPTNATILACKDIRKFVRVRGAKGGAVWFRHGVDSIAIGTDTWETPDEHGATCAVKRTLVGGVYMGRAVRWYYARNSKDTIIDGKSLNQIAGSEGARPVQILPVEFPNDINYQKYIDTAEDMLEELGI